MPPRIRSAAESTGECDAVDREAMKLLLAHLNLSGGRSDSAFLGNVNRIWDIVQEEDDPLLRLRTELLAELQRLEGTSSVFADCSQARAVIELTLPGCLEAYRDFHRDLLGYLDADQYHNPLFVGRLFEAVLAQGGPWTESQRILTGAIDHLNDFVGYRPVAVLENGRQMQPYPHERFAPLPLYIDGAGVAKGRFEPLISRTLEFLKEAPQDLLREAYLDPTKIRELALDVRAHDHLHPVNKRTNYLFGEWDPETIDLNGDYRRFVLRKVVLDAMLEWVNEPGQKTRTEERLFDAAAALCGTMLMASSVSGSGPDTHDSTVSLTTLLPVIARRRDEFYARLTAQATGARKKRLTTIERTTRQPFGHVRQHLNMYLAGYGARQIQYRELALLFARMGLLTAAREFAATIPAVSLRIECEMLCEISAARSDLRRGDVRSAVERLAPIEDLLTRGIQCGALVDPWNILGFAGQYPLFATREDAIPDNRVESLLELMAEIFNLSSELMVEAAARGDNHLVRQVSDRFEKCADWWDQFASSAIEDLPEVKGREAWESACHVASILREWRSAGEAAGDISFWKQHVERFKSAHAYGPVVSTLLDKGDQVASFALMMQWLSQLEDLGCEGPQHSLLGLLIRWMKLVTDPSSHCPHGEKPDLAVTLQRLFAYMEANADEAWSVPTLAGTLLSDNNGGKSPDWMNDDPVETDSDPDSDLFEAAWEHVTFKGSTEDGNWGDTLDDSHGIESGEFEQINRRLDPRLKFLNAVGQMWQLAAVALASRPRQTTGQHHPESSLHDSINSWRKQCRSWEASLLQLMDSVWEHDVESPSGNHNENVEFDLQLQVKYYLLNQIVVALLSLKNAERMLAACVPPEKPAGPSDELEALLSGIYGAVVRRDSDEVARRLPQLLKQMQKHPLLYVPFDHGGEPDQILRAQTMQSVARFLLHELPRLGLLRQTWHVLNTVFKMERKWRPEGQAITEFDRLFDVAIRSSFEVLLQSAAQWSDAASAPDDLLNALYELIEPYQHLWLKHSRTMRLSSVDGVRMEEDWEQLYDFIRDYGAHLFHASQLTLGHVRAILHHGVDWYLDVLRSEEDPLHPHPLLEAIDSGKISPEDAEWCLETLYSIVVDKFDRFLEYNTTTTQSDYGEMFYTLLDFLRVEARYDREAWTLTPLVTVHDVLARHQQTDSAEMWADMFEAQTSDLAERHLRDLRALELQHGMRLPAISDHLNQRLHKVLDVNEMTALVSRAIDGVRSPEGEQNEAAQQLLARVRRHLEDSWGSGIDIPAWIRALDREAAETLMFDEGGRPGAEAEFELPMITMTSREFRQQIITWRNSLTGPAPRRPGRKDAPAQKPPGKRRGPKNP